MFGIVPIGASLSEYHSVKVCVNFLCTSISLSLILNHECIYIIFSSPSVSLCMPLEA